MTMAQVTEADLADEPRHYSSPRNLFDVLVGEDPVRPVMEASSSGDDTALQSLLSQPQLSKTMLEQTHCIYDEDRPSQGPDDARQVLGMRMSHLERALAVAARNGHAAVVATLLSFAKQHGIGAFDIVSLSTINKIIYHGHAAVFKALGSAEPDMINFPLLHGTRPLYEAVRLGQPDVVAVLLELGADPFHPVDPSKQIRTYRSSLLSFAAFAEGPRITELLLARGLPVNNTAALHSAAGCGQLETMRLLIQHGADLNETIDGWSDRTPMHFAAAKGRVEAMKLLEQSGARSDLKDADGKTPAQLLEERNAA